MTLRDTLGDRATCFASAVSIFFYSILFMLLTDAVDNIPIPRWMWATRLIIFTASGVVSISILLFGKHGLELKPQEKGEQDAGPTAEPEAA